MRRTFITSSVRIARDSDSMTDPLLQEAAKFPRRSRILRYSDYASRKKMIHNPILFYTGVLLSSVYAFVGLIPYVLDSTMAAPSYDDPNVDDSSDLLTEVYFDSGSVTWRNQDISHTTSILVPKSLQN